MTMVCEPSHVRVWPGGASGRVAFSAGGSAVMSCVSVFWVEWLEEEEVICLLTLAKI